MRQPVQERSKRTRRLVLEAAARLIADHGVAGVSLQQIFDKAGVSRGSGQHVFKTKQEIALAIVREGFSMDAALPGKPRVQAVVDASIVLAWLTVMSPVVRAAARIVTEQENPETFGALWDGYVPMVTGILTEAAEEGELLADVDPGDVADHWVMAFTGYDLRCRRTVDELPRRIAKMNVWAVRGVVTPEIFDKLIFDVQRGLTLIAESDWASSYITDTDYRRKAGVPDGTAD
ncbi:TetR family transcriptional regulator [Streptomyces sp. NPDC002514]|uniref:TetR family transcriptional regulator n=1 Tax=unclassified Streptomyces TaxID=2593676 RepID=UPI0036CEF62D